MMKKKLFISHVFIFIYLLISIIIYAGDGTVPIGFVGDFSSVSKAYTQNMFMAARLAVHKFNTSGGLLGRQVELIKRDGANDPEKHYNHIITLVQEEKVTAIFGGASSPVVLKASEACRKNQIPYLVSIGNSQSIVIEYGHPFVFQFQPTSRMETKGFSIFVTLMPWQKYAWIGPDYSWGHDVLQNFKQQFEFMGAAIKWTTEVWHPLGTTDFKLNIAQILKSKPDALVIGSWGEDVRNFIKQAKKSGLFDKMAIFGWFTYNFNEDIGHEIPDGMWCLARGGPFNYLENKFPQTKEFVRAFNKEFNTYPNGYTICCYDSFLAWEQAVLKAKTTNPKVVAKTLKDLRFTGLRGNNVIRAVDGQMNCPTYFGRLVYQPEYPFAIWQSIIEVPAEKTWLDEEGIINIRKKSGS